MGFASPSVTTGASQSPGSSTDELRIPGIDGPAAAPNAAGPSARNNALSPSADASRSQTARSAQIASPLHGPTASPIDPNTAASDGAAPAASRISPLAPDSVSRSETHAAGGVQAYRAALEGSARNANAAGPAANNVADMSLAHKVATTAGTGIATAAKEAGGALGTALADPKTQALVAGGTAAIVGAQFVPGLDVAVDATLGTVGAAMYAAAAPGHRDNIIGAMGKLKDYVNEVGGAASQADLDRASRHFADFIKLGGGEALDALGTIAGGAVGAAKVASSLEAMGGISGVVSAASNLAGKVGETATDAGRSFVAAGDALGQRIINGLGIAPEFAAVGPSSAEMRALPDAVRPAASSGANGSRGAGSTQSAGSSNTGEAGQLAAGKALTQLQPNSIYEFKGGFLYHTDSQGRVSHVEATLTPGVQGGDRSQTLQKSAGGSYRLTTDEGGHLIATRFDGPAHEANHIAQDVKLNRSDFKKLENEWAKSLNAGKSVNVKIDLTYPSESARPESLRVNYSVDGIERRARTFVNGAP